MDFKLDIWLQEGAIIGKVGKWVEVFWGSPTNTATEADATTTAIYRNNFFRTYKKPWIIYPHSQKFEWKAWRQVVAQTPKPAEVELDWLDPSEDDFEKVFKGIQKDIKAKTLIKAVPVVTASAPRTVDPHDPMLHAIRQSPKNTFIYGNWGADGGFLGFTPEILFICEANKKIKTMALAGTRQKESYLRDPEDFLRDPKEQKEHSIVVEDITQRLAPLGKVKVGKTGALELNYLAHLYTPIQLLAQESQSFDALVKTLHPTPALGVFPREQLPLLKKWRDEQVFFGAPFGVRWSPDHFLSLVAIRQLQWDKKSYYISTGCGVVAESQFEEEWHELKIKRESVRRTFRL